MAQANPFDQFDSQVQPVPVRQLQPIIGVERKPPSGYEYDANGNLVPIPGGPADPTSKPEAAPSGYRFTPDGNLEPIPGGPAERGAQGNAVPVAAANEAKAGVSQFTSLTRALNTFKDDFGGNPLGGLENVTEGSILGVGTEGQSEWWADFKSTDNLIRNTLFGASLTEGEKAAYNATTITPAMRPDKIRANLQRRAEIIQGALQREREFFIANGYKPDAVDVLFRPVMQEGPTEEAAVNAPAQAPATREAAAGEAFLTEQDKELQAKLSQAYASGATLAELQALAQPYGQTIPIASQEELDAARAQGRGIVVTPTGREGGDAEYQSKVTAAADSFESRQGETGLAELAKQGVTLGLSDEAGGVGFALGQMLAGNFDVQDTYAFGRDVERELLRRARERTGGVGTAAELLGGGGAVRAVSAATTAGRAALEGAAGGSLGGFGYGEGTEGSLVGAGIGGATGGLISGGLQGLANRGAAQQARPRVIPDAADVIAAGEREGVDVMTSNVRPPRTWLGGWLRSTGEKLPIVGTAGTVAKQADQRAAMIERLADEYAQTPASIDDVTADFIKTRGGEIAKYAQMKRDVFGQTAGAPPPVARESIDALDMAIGRYGRQETFAGLTQKLQGWRNDLARAENINDIEAIRKSIGDTFGDQSMAASSAALKSIVDGPKGLYAALKNDMGGYIKDQAGQNAFRKWQVANGRLSDFAGDLEKTTLERILKTGEATPEEARLLLFSNKPSDVRALFRNLSPQGKERARAVVVQKLIDDAGGSVAISELSPAKFRSSLEKSMERIGVAFPKQEADRFTGMLRLLQATQNAEKAAVITPTGQSTLPFLGAGAGAAAFGDLFTGGTIAGLSMAAFRGYESKAMRNLLVALSKSKEGSKAERNILANIGRVLARTAPAAAAPTQAPPEQQPTSTIEVR